MTTEMTVSSRLDSSVAHSLVVQGDLSGLTDDQRVSLYLATCAAHGLNPSAQPFTFLRLNGKLVMYANRGAGDQLAAIHRLNREIIDGPKVVEFGGAKIGQCVARITHPNGRVETSIATLAITGDLAMLPMKLETKAKRRGTLAILGLAILDETEVESIPTKERGETFTPSVETLRSARVAEQVTDTRMRTLPPVPGMSPTMPVPADPMRAALVDVSSEQPASLRSLAATVDAEPADDATRAAGERATLRLALLEQVSRCKTPGAVADLWVASKTERDALTEDDVKVVWKASVNRVKEHQRSTDAGAKSWLKKAVAERTPPDDGTNGPTKPRNGRSADATGNGAANDSARADGAVACVRDPVWSQSADELRRHLSTKTCVTMLRNSLAAHAAELTADACALYAQRYADLWAAMPDHAGGTLHPRSARAWVDGVLAQAARGERRAA